MVTFTFHAPVETDSEFRARILASLAKPMKCTECNDTRVYLGLGTAPPEPCRACQPQSTPKVCRSSWQGLEFGRSVIPADVGGPMNLLPTPGPSTPQRTPEDYCIEVIHQRTVAQQIVAMAKSDDDGITMIDMKFQATIDEWFEALQARIDAIMGQ